ncbi:MAG: GvpL/GvpF family gas vesicle protein, partial [Bacteroidota bacterium]
MQKENTLTYLYCICDKLPKLPNISFENNLEVVTINEFFAVIESVSDEQFGEKVLNANIADLTWLVSKVNIHEGVIENIMTQATVLPSKFATIYTEKAHLIKILRGKQNEFYTTLENLRGKQEWGVKIYLTSPTTWLPEDVKDEELHKMELALTNATPGKAYILKKKLHTLAKNKQQQLMQSWRTGLYNAIKATAVESLQKAIHPVKDDSDVEGKLILNGVFL